MKIRELLEITHKTGVAAQRALQPTSITPDLQQKAQIKWQQLHDREKQIMSQPDAHTGKYASDLMNISKQKIRTAKSGNLDAFGKPLLEYASGGATSSGSVAGVMNPFGIIMRQPSLFGYVPAKKQPKPRKSRTSHK